MEALIIYMAVFAIAFFGTIVVGKAILAIFGKDKGSGD